MRSLWRKDKRSLRENDYYDKVISAKRWNNIASLCSWCLRNWQHLFVWVDRYRTYDTKTKKVSLLLLCCEQQKKNVIYTEYPNSTFANWEIELCGFLMGEKWFYQVQQQTLQKQRLIFISTSALSEENSHAVLELHLHIFDEWSLSKENCSFFKVLLPLLAYVLRVV